MRYNQLLRAIDATSPRMLTAALRGLERDGVVTRVVYPMDSQRVDYALTEFGCTLIRPLVDLGDWARKNQSKVEEARSKFDAMPRRRQDEGNRGSYPWVASRIFRV
jgi:DNA-binding HxlR family transcriptional regulator